MGLYSRQESRRSIAVLQLVVFLALFPVFGIAQAPKANPRSSGTVTAILTSDIHFDPFADPSKVRQLAEAPIEQWEALLKNPAAGSQQAYQKLLETCGTRGPDTPFALFKASLLEMKTRAPRALFVTVTGDLLAHSFECKFKQTMPAGDANVKAAFTAKTITFVAHLIRANLPGIPVYFALGNNDSDCGDYRLDPHSRFFSAIAPAMTSDVPLAQRAKATSDFSDAGFYAVDLPVPRHNIRLLVIDDTFMAERFATCSGKDDRTGEELTLHWLAAQLDAARSAHRGIWVMGHIPPGIDLKGSVSRKTMSVCGGEPKTYLDNANLADTLVNSGDIVRLALFGHTHMDEIHLLTPPGSPKLHAAANVPLKIVPSITPINGNNPSFLIASINPGTAQIADYKLIAASDSDPAKIQWKQSYDFQNIYHQSAFSNDAIASLTSALRADPEGSSPASTNYIENFMPGTGNQLLRLVWPAYACSISSQDPNAFRTCACSK